MNELKYGLSTVVKDATFGDVVEGVTSALKDEGFGVLTTIDVQATLKKKLDRDFRPYMILGACNPELAHQALEHDPQIGLLLPCNVVVQQAEPNEVWVSIADPVAMFRITDDVRLEPLAKDVAQRLTRVLDALGS